YKWKATGSPWTDVGGYLLLTGVTPEYAVSRLNRMTPPPEAGAWIRAHTGLWLAKGSPHAGSVAPRAPWVPGPRARRPPAPARPRVAVPRHRPGPRLPPRGRPGRGAAHAAQRRARGGPAHALPAAAHRDRARDRRRRAAHAAARAVRARAHRDRRRRR